MDAAVELTRESHLMSWSIRDLAGRLGVAASVIYHHVGGKDLLCRRVVERMLEQIVPPEPSQPWQQWFRELLHTAGPLAAAYPGTAKWMLMHGPTLPAVLPILDAGVATLQRAGLGEQAPFAYALLLNNAMLTVSMGDDRLQHEGDGPRDHATMMAELRQMPTASAEVRAMARNSSPPSRKAGNWPRRGAGTTTASSWTPPSRASTPPLAGRPIRPEAVGRAVGGYRPAATGARRRPTAPADRHRCSAGRRPRRHRRHRRRHRARRLRAP